MMALNNNDPCHARIIKRPNALKILKCCGFVCHNIVCFVEINETVLLPGETAVRLWIVSDMPFISPP